MYGTPTLGRYVSSAQLQAVHTTEENKMSEELTNEAVDAAVILENRVNERVEKEVEKALASRLRKAVVAEVVKAISEEKQNMMMEISITVGKALRASELEGRKPLWESTPEELGLDRSDLNSSSMRRLDDVQENLNAIRKQT
jgi:hypothetical protein